MAPVIDQDSIKAGSSLVKKSNIPVSWIKEATDLINAGNSLIGGIARIVDTVKGFQQAPGSNIIQSGPGAKTSKGAPAQAQEPSKKDLNDKDLETYFRSPAGIKKIGEAIDNFMSNFGDCKLSELKSLLSIAEKTKKTTSKGEKK